MPRRKRGKAHQVDGAAPVARRNSRRCC